MAKTKSKAYWVFGNDKTREAVVLASPSFERIEALKAKGFKLLWDSAPSKEKGYAYAAEHGDGEGLHYFPTQCRFCMGYREVHRVRGQKWSESAGKWVIYNGTACDMCMEDTDILKVTPVPAKQVTK